MKKSFVEDVVAPFCAASVAFIGVMLILCGPIALVGYIIYRIVWG